MGRKNHVYFFIDSDDKRQMEKIKNKLEPRRENIELSNLCTPILARFPRDASVGFSTIPFGFPSSPRVKMPKSSGLSTGFTSVA